MGVSLAGRNLARVAWNQSARLLRRAASHLRRGSKQAREARKELVAQARGAVDLSRDTGMHLYAGGVKTSRYWARMREQTVPRLMRDVSIRRELSVVARGSQPIIVGPWLSEVGFETLYWVPFLRWFVDHYRVDPSRLVVVSRGGAGAWYGDLAGRYVELLDLFTPEEFARRNAERQARGDQKQTAVGELDREVLQRVQERLDIGNATVCHPSTMFRLMRQFWLGNDSLQYILDYLHYRPVVPPPVAGLPLPERFVAVKFYSGRALPDVPANRDAVRALVHRFGRSLPIVLLDTGLALDEHEDITWQGADVMSLAPHLTPQNNLAVQAAVIARASLYLGTCGSLAWLAPLLGTETLAVYADDYFLTPHLYAAKSAYRQVGAAPFAALDLRAVGQLL